jgi:hypothetical protein
MNFVSFSADFPANYYPFAVELRRAGVTVLGLSEAYFGNLRAELRAALNEFYRVNSMHNYDELVRALGYFTHRYGKLDRLESHNEYWLESDACLRTDFNIPGFHNEDMARIKRKSAMKAIFNQARVPAARGRVAGTLEEALKLVDEAGYPLIAKPDIGVGAAATYKLNSRAELEGFFQNKPAVDYIFEEFITGDLISFDGLADRQGQVVFSSTMAFNEGVMESVSRQDDFWYVIQRAIPDDLDKLGRRLVKAFGVSERFFHFEFFRTAGGSLVALEVNMRPPGGLTTDMWNYANDINIYREYANIVTRDCFEARITRPYYCAYFGRRNRHRYVHSIEQTGAAFPGKVVHHEPINGIFAPAIGDYGIVARSPDKDEIDAMAEYVLKQS